MDTDAAAASTSSSSSSAPPIAQPLASCQDVGSPSPPLLPPGPPNRLSRPPPPEGTSKNAWKRQLKHAAYLARRPEKRKAERAKKKEKKKRAQGNAKVKEAEAQSETKAEVHLESNGHANGDDKGKAKERPKRRTFKARLVIDCGFDELMTEKEVKSMGQQLSYLYSANRKSSAPFENLIFVGPGEYRASILPDEEGDEFDAESASSSSSSSSSSSLLDTIPRSNVSAIKDGYVSRLIVNRDNGTSIPFCESRIGKALDGAGRGQWRRWRGVDIIDHGGLEALWHPEKRHSASIPRDDDGGSTPSTAPILRQEDIIYLTADNTEDTIDELEEGKTYVIGGIVDRNRYKNLCYTKSLSLSLRSARLPIDPQHLLKRTSAGQTMNSRRVLTVNQVAEILLGWTEQYQRSAAKAVADDDDDDDDDDDGDQGRESGQGEQWQKPSWETALERGLPNRKFEDVPRGTVEREARCDKVKQRDGHERVIGRGERDSDDDEV